MRRTIIVTLDSKCQFVVEYTFQQGTPEDHAEADITAIHRLTAAGWEPVEILTVGKGYKEIHSIYKTEIRDAADADARQFDKQLERALNAVRGGAEEVSYED